TANSIYFLTLCRCFLPLTMSPVSPLPDYQSLRIGGLVFAVVLFTVGILLILSKLGMWWVLGWQAGAAGAVPVLGGHWERSHPLLATLTVSLPLQAGGAGAVSSRSPG
uniref:FXYD domain-containing ion transport regulator n=1 Tax=Cyanistes caeruleus TaxID=156563 RepID=A0A8C0U582_CYACU